MISQHKHFSIDVLLELPNPPYNISLEKLHRHGATISWSLYLVDKRKLAGLEMSISKTKDKQEHPDVQTHHVIQVSVNVN